MTTEKISAETNGPMTLVRRAAMVIDGIRTWASTEAGGWIIVSALAIMALIITAAVVVLPRLQDRPASPTGTAAAPAAGLPSQNDLVDFTLAPEAIQDMDYAEARLWNAALPFSTAPIRPAAALIAPTTDIEAYSRAVDCLTAAVYYEAASETPQGQAAVAQVVLNRARHPAYPRTVCGVVFQGSERSTGCQFSFTCDGAMERVPSTVGWARARAVASSALNGTVIAAVGTATHYHTDWVAPYWAPRLSKIVQIGTHIFYRWNGAWGLPTAFNGAYSGAEPVIAKMAALSSISVLPPAEVLSISDIGAPIIAEDAPRLTVAIDVPQAAETATNSQPEDTQSATTAVDPEPIVQRIAPIMADPMARPITEPTRQRQRIAAPSGW